MASSVGDSETACLPRERHLLALDGAVRHVDTLILVLDLRVSHVVFWMFCLGAARREL